MSTHETYDIALSFAGEDREYVDKVAKTLRSKGVKVFYDKFDEVNLWGKNLYDYLSTIYTKKARFTVIFISKHYHEKLWTTHERRSAQARAFEESQEYILPARFDDTEIPGILSTTCYINLDEKSPSDLANTICAKLDQVLPAKKLETVTTIAVMGVKGGVGKGMFVACIAQLFAEANHDVAIIDYDLESCGTTRNSSRRFQMSQPPVKTVYDHIAPKSEGFNEHKGVEEDILWDITPEYLKEKNLGKIWLLPASNPSEYTRAWDIVPNLPIPHREQLLLVLTQEMIDRVKYHNSVVRWIVIDCGAGKNPIFSAAFAQADYGYIIMPPDESFFDEVEQIKKEHKERFKETFKEQKFSRIFTVANRVTSQADIERLRACNPKCLIPRNPLFEEDDFQEPIDYDLGYNDIAMAIRNCLAKTLVDDDKSLVPDELTVRILPWWTQFVKNKLATRTLKSPSFYTRTILLLGGALGGSVSLLACISYNVWRYHFSTLPSTDTLALTNSLLILFLFFLVAVSIYYLLPHWRNRRLLKRIASSSALSRTEYYKLLQELLDDADRSSLHWLRQLLRKEQELDKTRRRGL